MPCWERGVSLAILFAVGDTASRLIVSIPAVARALREVARAEIASCTVCVAAPWQSTAFESAEIARLARPEVAFAAEVPVDCTVVALGEALVPASILRAAMGGMMANAAAVFPAEAVARNRISIAQADVLLRVQARAIIAATGKPGDGIVSRTINRPISQAITRILLKLGPIRPHQATFGTIAVSLAVAIALLFPRLPRSALGWAALSNGFDRRWRRRRDRPRNLSHHPLGATFDSLVDATTNLSFSHA